tara:strand:- start:181 stop:378 length:198 start_codon:yes stop_codon:yes gene_type:complete
MACHDGNRNLWKSLPWFWAVSQLRKKERKRIFHIKHPSEYNTRQVCDDRAKPIFTHGLTSQNIMA